MDIPDEFTVDALYKLAKKAKCNINCFYRKEKNYVAMIIVSMPDGAQGCVEETDVIPNIAQMNCCRRAISALVYESLISEEDIEHILQECEPNKYNIWFLHGS